MSTIKFVLYQCGNIQHISSFHLQSLLHPVVHHFGQKKVPAIFEFDRMFNAQGAMEVSVHVGLNVYPKQPETCIMWSRVGLETVSRTRGDLYPCLAIFHCANLTVLATDVLPLVEQSLSSIFRPPSEDAKVLYLQLYNTSPNYRPPEFHCISGLQATAGCMHYKVSCVI